MVSVSVRDHDGIDPLTHDFLNVIRARMGNVRLWLQPGIDENARFACLDKQGTAPDAVRAPNRGDGKTACPDLRH